MSGFFSHSSSKRRYPNPNMGGAYYRKKGLFGMLSVFGSSSGSDFHRASRHRNPNQGYPGQQRYAQTGNANQMICPKCGASVPAGSKFCLSCGEKLGTNAAFCPNCGKPLPPGAKFCTECGTPVQR